MEQVKGRNGLSVFGEQEDICVNGEMAAMKCRIYGYSQQKQYVAGQVKYQLIAGVVGHLLMGLPLWNSALPP